MNAKTNTLTAFSFLDTNAKGEQLALVVWVDARL